MKKLAIDLNRDLTEEDRQVEINLKRSYTLLLIKKMQMQSTGGHPPPSAGEDTTLHKVCSSEISIVHCRWEHKTVLALQKTFWYFFYKVKYTLSNDAVILHVFSLEE